jgi:IPT/TIG domain
MRSKRSFTARVASLGAAVALVGAGLAGSVGLVASSTTAGADTGPITANCTFMVAGSPVSETLTGLVITGSLSPAAPTSGQSFTVANLALLFSFGSLSADIVGDTISGSETTTLTASGATPASQSVTFTIPSTVVVTNQPPIRAPGSAVSFTAGSGTPPPSVSTGGSTTVNINISGPIGAVTGSCTSTPQVIAAAPTPAAVTAVLPNSAPLAGGTTVTIHGTSLGSPTAVNFGTTPATSFKSLTANSISAVVPSSVGSGPVDVHVVTTGGKSPTNAPGDQLTYTNGPIVTGVSPNTATPSGGTTVTINGLQLNGATGVNFGPNAGTVTADSATSITATSPAGTGVVNVVVSGPGACASVEAKICLARGEIASIPSIVSQLDSFNYQAGYWLTASDGGVFNYGFTPFKGSMGGTPLNKPVVGMASTPDANGYWLAASDGGVFAFQDANFWGSAGSLTLNKPVVGIAATPDGFGYWLVASDGGVFSYGDAQFFGSTGGLTLNQPIVGMASTPDGGGYWLVAADGGVFAFGDAAFHGSMGGQKLNQPVVGIASTPDGGGYWLVAADGGIFSFGDAVFQGSTGSLKLNKPIVGMASAPGGGYWLDASDGGVFSFGATFYGSAGSLKLNQPMVGMAAAG